MKKREEALLNLAALLYENLATIIPVLKKWIADINHSSDISERLMPHIMEMDPAVRKSAAYSLGKMQYRPAISEILTLFKDPHLWVRDAAVLSLALFQDEALPQLSRSLERENSSFKILAMDVLKRINSVRSKKLIEKYLDHGDEGVRRAAQKALSGF